MCLYIKCHMELSIKIFLLGKVVLMLMKILNVLSFFRVIVQASFSLFNLPLADIVDADLIKHKRRYVKHTSAHNIYYMKCHHILLSMFIV